MKIFVKKVDGIVLPQRGSTVAAGYDIVATSDPKIVGEKIASKVRELSLQLYTEAAEYAETRGIIIADTKFEFGLDAAGELVLIDEILTADSSRFWPAKQYQVGISPPSYDKQFVRDYLETLDWDKRAPAPHLPDQVVSRTADKYRDALERLTGQRLD